MATSSSRGFPPSARDELLLTEQRAYYRAIAREYRDHWLPFAGGDELVAAVEAFQPRGHVLELACGPGVWTGQLARHAAAVTAVDGSAEMLEIAAAGIRTERVRFVRADLFEWQPSRRYDVVFFGFWQSHVPPARFDSFWALVADCLEPDGRVLFVDDAHRRADELVEGESSVVVRRRLNDGTPYDIIKVATSPPSWSRAWLSWAGESRSGRPPGRSTGGAGTRADDHDRAPSAT